MRDESYDVFLSYSWDNYVIAVALAEALEAAGLRVFRDETGMRDYEPISSSIEQALAGSRSVVALYTPEFPASAYCQWELYTALSRAYALDGHAGRIFAVLHGVRYEDVRPARLTSLRLPLPDTDFGTVVRSVADKLATIDRRTLGDAPTHRPPDWYPYPAPALRSFTGRFAELWDLHEALVITDPAEVSGPALVRIVGLGGQGKTVLVEEYARRFGQDHPAGVFVVRGLDGLDGHGGQGRGHGPLASVGTIRALRDRQIADIVRKLEPDATGLSPVEIEALLLRHLESDGRPYLWIIDDLPTGVPVATLRELMAPTARGRTLVTTRVDENAHGGVVMRLDGLSDDAAISLLTSRRPAARAEHGDVRRLACRDLGGHPQSLELASAMTVRPDFTGYAWLAAEISSPSRDALELAAELRTDLPGGHLPGIAATLLGSLNRLGGPGRQVLQVASLLAAAPIPQPLFAEALTAAGSSTTAVSRPDTLVADGLAEAASVGLASLARTEEPPLWTVHQVICRTVRFVDLADRRRDRLRLGLVQILINLLDATRDSLRYRRLVDYLPHVAAVARDAADGDQRYVLNEAGRAQVELGDLDGAAAGFARLYQACRSSLGERDVITLSVLTALGAVEGMRGQHRLALDLKIQAHAGLTQVLGGDDPDAITAQNNVGVGYLELEEPAHARQVLRSVYRARWKRLGVHHTDTLLAMGNYAIACARLGEHRLALRLRTLVYERMCRLRGGDDPLTLEALNNLGAGHHDHGDLAAARDAFRQVHEGRVAVLGEDHPQTVAARANLAITYVDDPPQAAASLAEAYRDLVRIGNPGTPVTLTVLNNLLLALTRDPASPRPLRPAAAVTDAARTPDPAQLAGAGDLTLIDDLDRHADVRVDLFERAAAVQAGFADRYGPDDPGTMVAACYLAHATAALGQMENQINAAVVLIEDAHAGLREILGADHPEARLAERLHRWIADRAGGA